MGKIVVIRDKALQSRDAIEVLTNKWRITILHILEEGPLRTSAIQGAIPAVSPKMLTQTLRGMERDGLLSRKIYRAVPPRVEYRLTGMGESLIRPLQELCHWAKAHTDERDAARARFDQAEAGETDAARGRLPQNSAKQTKLHRGPK